jgi:hypothetical protein
MEKNILPEMVDNFNSLPVHLQEHVLKYIKQLKNDLSDKKSTTSLSRFAGSIPSDDLDIMREVVEKDCRQVDIDGW